MIAKIAISYALTLAVFIALDFFWVGLLMKNFYRNGIGHLMASAFNYLAIGIFYLVYMGGLFFFAVYPGYLQESIATGALLGGMIGFFCYATYDLTNMGTLRGWPLRVTVVDIVWGILASASAASIGVLVLQLISN